MGLNLTPIDIPPGLVSDDTTFAASPAWVDMSLMRWRKGRPQTVGGWQSLTLSLLKGVCRSVLSWTDLSNTQNIGFGLHNGLQVWSGGLLSDVTPTLQLPSATLPTDPLTATAGSAVYNVNHPNHQYATGETITLSGAAGSGRQVLSGNYTLTVVDANTYSITAGANAILLKTLGANPLSVTNASTLVTVTDTGHNIENGAQVTIAGATALGGITPNGTFPITVIDANTYSFNFTVAATSTATGGGSAVTSTPAAAGGGSACVVQNTRAWQGGGAIDGAGSAGYGTGAYGTGGYGQPSTISYFALTWSLAAWGANLIANPRGQGIYQWTNSGVAAPIANSPQSVTYTLVTQQRQIMALGCNDEVTGVFNPMLVRHSGVQNPTQWNTLASSASTARSYALPGGGRIVAGVAVGPYVLIWTNFGLFLGTYVGSINQVWSFNPVANGCGLIGPNAFTVVGQTVYWMSPDKQFWSYSLGGMPQLIDCWILNDLRENMALAQADKIVMSHMAQFGELWCLYPDARDGFENSRYVGCNIMGADASDWFRGQLARTAFCDAGPYPYPVGVTYAGNVYEHEHGNSADGAALSWFITTSDLMLDDNFSMLTRKYFPDFTPDQIGAVSLTVTTTMFPNDPNPRTFGPYTVVKNQTMVDILAEGRFFSVTFAGNSAPSYARIGRLLFDAKQRGRW